MTTPGPAIQGAQSASDAASAWRQVHADPAIQYAPVDLKIAPPEIPDWLLMVGRALRAVFEPVARALGMSWPVLQWVLIALAVLGAGYVLWQFAEPLRSRWQAAQTTANKPAAGSETGWRPAPAEALALLDDADRLASDGRFDEAARMLLTRSVQQIAAARPDWVGRASTAREIAGIGALPDAPRRAFAVIAGRVERSLFALKSLDAADWQAARGAYTEFAVERLSAAGAA